MLWYWPSWSGDWRLEADGADKSVLTIVSPTPAEVEQLGAFLKRARSKAWVAQHVGFIPNGTVTIPVAAPIDKAGRALLGWNRWRKGVLTVVRSANGEVTAVIDGDSDKAERAVAAAAGKDKEAPLAEPVKPQEKPAAVTVSRPTCCCPLPDTVADVRATEVLHAFCTPRQRAEMARDGVIHCYGNLSGRRYEIAHRHHPAAIQRGKVIFDTEGGYVIHAHASHVPAAEEVLTMKLVLEHAEDWVRNPSGCFHHDGPVYDNPFGMGMMDGVKDAAFMASFGRSILALTKLIGD